MVLRRLISSALLSLLLLASACFPLRRVVLGTDLSPIGRQVLLWPADESGERFRFLRTDHRANVSYVAPTRIVGHADAELAAVIDEDVSAVILLLPPMPSSALRQRASVILAMLGENRPGLGLHLVQTELDLVRIDRTRQMTAALDQVHHERAKQHAGFLDPYMFLVWTHELRQLAEPRWSLVPQRTARGSQLTLIDWQTEAPIARLVHFEEARDELLESAGIWEGRIQDDPDNLMRPFVAFLVPRDAPDDCVRQCAELEDALLATNRPNVSIVRAQLAWGWDSIDGPDELLAHLDPIEWWDFVDPPVRVTVLRAPIDAEGRQLPR